MSSGFRVPSSEHKKSSVRVRESPAHPGLGPRTSGLVVRHLGLVDYERVWRDMQAFTEARQADTPDQLWLLQHPPVYTLGLAGRSEHLRQTDTSIPVRRTDRGGQVTYHGPGQIVVYTLLDLRRRSLGVRQLVRRLEQAVIDLLAAHGIVASGQESAPGVYVDGAKIAALGLRIRKGCSYHGLAFNVDMDLGPFDDIDPCGYAGLRVTQARDLGIAENIDRLGEELLGTLQSNLESI